jgi:hypothetical protein
MVDVSEWAKREAERVFDGGAHFTAHGYRLGLERMADLLLSDEAVSEAAAVLAWDRWPVGTMLDEDGPELIESMGDLARQVLQAAVSAVITTNPTSPDSGSDH